MEKAFLIDETLELFFNIERGWILKNNNEFIEIEDKIIFLFPLLEINFQDFKNTITSKPLGLEKFKKFPLLPLLKAPFEIEMAYWADLSLNWINDSKSELNLTDWANSIKLAWMPQKLKHKFWRTFSKASRLT